jgi:hypothetical protein
VADVSWGTDEAQTGISRLFWKQKMQQLTKQREPANSLRSHVLPALSVMGALACFLALDAGSPARAQTLNPAPTWTVTHPKCADSAKICIMTFKIFNNDPNHWIYPVLSTGKGPADIWMQAWWSVPQASLDQYRFPRWKNYRLYINPTGNGIPPNTGIELTLPIYTQLKEPMNPNPPQDKTSPSGGDTLINWWNGGIIQVYVSPTASPPEALTEALKGITSEGTQQQVTSTVGTAILPTCVVVPSAPTPRPPSPAPCQPLTIYSDDADLPKNDPSQLIEYTVGARNDPIDPGKGSYYLLDTANVDFDVSYVNVAFAPAVMGPYKNDQVGYIGSLKNIGDFNKAIDQFLQAYPGWPQFVRKGVIIKKLASPLEAFARLGGVAPPPDLTNVPVWPNEIWTPLQDMRTKWTQYAGTVVATAGPVWVKATPGLCGPLPRPSAVAPANFCDAVVAIQQLLIQNYINYRKIYDDKQCPGLPVNITDNLLISHVYGWAPWTESSTGVKTDGCGPSQNLLQKTPGYSSIITDVPPIVPPRIDYKNYAGVKLAFDKLNYGKLPEKVAGQKYNFNPWVELIHGVPAPTPTNPKNKNPEFIGTDYAYAYSVDDAMGNIQAEGQGIIIDIGSTINLENQKPASEPITITVGGPVTVESQDGTKTTLSFTHYAVCKNAPERKKELNPRYTTIVISSNDPASCPIYLWDSKSQFYAFNIDVTPDKFALITEPKKQIWTAGNAVPSTTSMVVCSGLPGATVANGYQPTSATFCCDSASSSGIKAFAFPLPDDAHHGKKNMVITASPMACPNYVDKTCWARGLPPDPVRACNKGL